MPAVDKPFMQILSTYITVLLLALFIFIRRDSVELDWKQAKK